MIKHIITSGCSFSDALLDHGWPRLLEKYFPNCSYEHLGLGSQGQDLIQKKASLAVIESLKNFRADEICVIVMWSGTERKSFFVDNKDFINEVAQGWKKGSQWWNKQFCDLKNNVDFTSYAEDTRTKNKTYFNKEGGWYICNYLTPDSEFTKQYFDLSRSLIGPVVNSLENIIFLQNLCKVKGVRLVQSFYRDYTWQDIFENKHDQNVSYLYECLDFSTIVSATGMYEHLRPLDPTRFQFNPLNGIFANIFKISVTDESKKYFLDDNWHPNELGATKWLEEVLVPYLRKVVFPTSV